MKLVKNKSSQKIKIVIATAVVVVFAVTAWMIVAHASSSWPFGPAQTTNSQVDDTNPLGVDRDETTNDADQAGPTKSPSQYEGTNPNTTPSLTGFISYNSVVDGNLVVRLTIDQALTSGTCKLTLTKGGSSITKTSSIIANPSSSTCSGFDVPTSELSSGAWTIQIILTSADKTGTITGEVTI